MLAQNFKTPAALGITEEEFAALARVLAMLERDEIPHHNRTREWQDDCDLVSFNMSEWHCGSAGCLGGWAEQIGRLPYHSLRHRADEHPELYNLFYPDGSDGCGVIPSPQLNDVTPSQAAVALRNYLTHGEPRWSEAMA